MGSKCIGKLATICLATKTIEHPYCCLHRLSNWTWTRRGRSRDRCKMGWIGSSWSCPCRPPNSSQSDSSRSLSEEFPCCSLYSVFWLRSKSFLATFPNLHPSLANLNACIWHSLRESWCLPHRHFVSRDHRWPSTCTASQRVWDNKSWMSSWGSQLSSLVCGFSSYS